MKKLVQKIAGFSKVRLFQLKSGDYIFKPSQTAKNIQASQNTWDTEAALVE